MYRLFALACLLAVSGCADKPDSPPTAEEILDDRATTADTPKDVPAPQHTPPFRYPEMADVERLLVRASELESNGKFNEALEVANQAVAIDPSSPSANEMKAKLEELLRRIQDSPELDERAGATKVVQRTTP